MRSFAIVLCAALVSACSSVPVVHTSFNGMSYTSAPTSATDPRLRQPSYYRDEGDSIPWLRNAGPRDNR